MKKTLSLILAALLLASSMTACGKTELKETTAQTTAPETTAPATQAPAPDAPATNAPDTDAPDAYPYDTDIVTENGVAKAHIVVPNGTAEDAEQLFTYAAEELVYHIKKVTGADISVANEVQEGSLPIIIATPDSLPELETLFPNDLAWLRDLGNPDEDVRFGDDGFAIRSVDGKLYIFGVTPRGALNGVYDFIEDNMGVLWIRANEELGLVYDEMPTVTVAKTDYREKSPFQLRAWTVDGYSTESAVMYSRNKLNTFPLRPHLVSGSAYSDVGLSTFVTNHNVEYWIKASPSYDPNCTEYWSTNISGEHVPSAADSQQVNIWSDRTVEAIADHIILFLDAYRDQADTDYIGVNMEDVESFSVYPEMTEPYEYAPGKLVYPEENEYLSTVYLSFLNKIAGKVGEKYPDVIIHAYFYMSIEKPPKSDMELADNCYVTYCASNEDLCADRFDETIADGYLDTQNLLKWMEFTPNVQVYTYYGCCTAGPLYERAIWNRIQSDLKWFAANGFNGMVPEGGMDITANIWEGRLENSGDRVPYYTYQGNWTMNALTYWLYGKLLWNPDEDVDALIDYYCEKVYGDAAPYMREYYSLIEKGWAAGGENIKSDFQSHMKFSTRLEYYYDYFMNIEVDGVNILEACVEALNKAWDAANDVQKERMRQIRDVYNDAENLFLE